MCDSVEASGKASSQVPKELCGMKAQTLGVWETQKHLLILQSYMSPESWKNSFFNMSFPGAAQYPACPLGICSKIPRDP